MRFHLSPVAAKALAGVAATCLCGGCISPWFNGFLDPTQVGNFHETCVSEIQQTISFRDTPPGVPGATEPTPDDLVQTVEDYRIGVGDQLSIRMLDFLMRDVETEFTPMVNDLGYIYIPQLGEIHVEGMTQRDLRLELINRAKDKGIYRPESEPTVVVTFLTQQQRMYHISGTILTPGRYRIIPPDFRLREAINQAGGLDPTVKNVYVFRNAPKPKRVVEEAPRPGGTGSAPAPTTPAPPVSPVSLSDAPAGPNPPPAPAPPRPAAPVQTQPRTDRERQLIEAISPQGLPPWGTAPARPAEQPKPEAAPTPQTLPTYIYINDRFVESPRPATQPAQPLPPPAPVVREAFPPASQPAQPVNWQEIASEGQQRIIRIPAQKLHNGDPNYNIVIKPEDWIRLDSGYVGVFYLMGHVNRGGVYSLTGQEITLRQAIAAAGGLDALAWPTRCEIIRRIDGDREEMTQWDLSRIMDGKDPDLFLKPEDVINVGTHAIAPLLATVRNSFRLTYGFGFVYDRNFADIDSFFAKANPSDVRRQRLATRFPGLFP